MTAEPVDVEALREALAESGMPKEFWALDIASGGMHRIQARYPGDPDSRGQVGRIYSPADAELIVRLRNNAEALLDTLDEWKALWVHKDDLWKARVEQCEALEVALDRAQAAAEGVEMLVAQAERRGAVEALREAADSVSDRYESRWLGERADDVENGADL